MNWDPNPKQWREILQREEEVEIVSLELVNRKLNALIEGLGIIMGTQASLLEGYRTMQAELQPIQDALSHLTDEAGLVKSAVDAIVTKVGNGQVVNQDDVNSLVSSINSVASTLAGVVTEAAPEPAPVVADPVPAPTDPIQSDPIPAPTPPVEEPPVDPAPVVTEPVEETPVVVTEPVEETPVDSQPLTLSVPDLTPPTQASL